MANYCSSARAHLHLDMQHFAFFKTLIIYGGQTIKDILQLTRVSERSGRCEKTIYSCQGFRGGRFKTAHEDLWPQKKFAACNHQTCYVMSITFLRWANCIDRYVIEAVFTNWHLLFNIRKEIMCIAVPHTECQKIPEVRARAQFKRIQIKKRGQIAFCVFPCL